MDKKIIYSFNNFSNKSFNIFLKKKLIKKNSFLYTSNKIALKFFDKKKVVIANKIEPNQLEKFSSFKKNQVETLYVLKAFLNGGIIKKFLIITKYFLDFINILPEKKFFRTRKINIPNKIKNFDILYCDFRLNEIYSNNLINNYADYFKKKIYCYVFSWDNYYATDVVKNADMYFAHSIYFKNVLIDKHNISKKKIKIQSPFQFHYLKNNKYKINNLTNKKKYLIYAFSHSVFEKNYFREEVELLRFISMQVSKIDKKILIIARLYPNDFVHTNEIFKNLTNVKVQVYGKIYEINKYKKFVFDHNLKKKYQLIKNSIGCINVFTTFGIESLLLNKPTIFVAIKNNKNFFNYTNSIHFKLNYMSHFKTVKSNIVFINNYDKLKNIINDLLLSPEKIISDKKNNQIKKLFNF